MSDEWVNEAMRLKDSLIGAVRRLQFGGTAQEYREADEALIKHLNSLRPDGVRVLDPNLPQLCRYATPFPELKTRPCDCAAGVCRLHRKPTAGVNASDASGITDRQKLETLAAAIAAAAQKAGIYNGEVPLAGPHLLQLLNDLAKGPCAPAGVAPSEPTRSQRMAAAGFMRRKTGMSAGGLMREDDTAGVPASDDARDAARYRWLRQQHWNEAPMCVVMQPRKAVKLGHDCPALARLDAAIDDAMVAAGVKERS